MRTPDAPAALAAARRTAECHARVIELAQPRAFAANDMSCARDCTPARGRTPGAGSLMPTSVTWHGPTDQVRLESHRR